MPDEPVTPTPVTPAPEVDKEALEIGEIIKASGFSKGDVNVLTESAVSLASLRNLVENNPKGFLESLEKANPEAAQKFHAALAEEYVNRYDDKGDKDDKDPNKTLMSEIKSLRERITANETDQQRRDAAAAMSQIKSRYDARVDDLLSHLPDDLAMTKTEKAAFRAKLNTDLAADPAAIERCSKGNFVDVPKKFKEIVSEWTSDKKAAADAEKAKRDGVKSRASGELSNGPNPFAVDLPKDFADSWDLTESAFAKELEKYSE